MKLGSTDITSIKLGSADVVKLMLGSTEVWGAGGELTNLAATAGNGTTTLTWDEAGTFDSVNIYKDDVLEDNVSSGVGTWTSDTLADGLYEWHVVPVASTVEGTPSGTVTYGCMAGDVWVDTANGSDSNDGTTPALAVATLNEAGSLVDAAGMRVVVRGGTYSEYNSRGTSATYGGQATTFTQHGTLQAPCELRSFPGENVIIDGSSIQRPLGGEATDPYRPELLQVDGNYWLIEGWDGYPIHIQNSAGSGIRVDEAPIGVTIRYVHSHNHEGTGFNMLSSRFATVEHCAAWGCYSTVNDGESADGLGGGGSSGTIMGSDNLTVSNCFFAFNGDDGIDLITATNATVSNVVCYKNGYFENGTPGQGNGNNFKMGGSAMGDVEANIVFHNCISVGARNLGFTMNGGWGIDCAQCVSIEDGRGFVGREGGETVRFLNNIAYDPDGPNLIDDAQGDGVPTEIYNSWNDPPDVTVTSGDFQNLTFNESWRSWAEVVAANYAALDAGSDMKAAGDDGQDLGYEGTYTPPPPEPQNTEISVISGTEDGVLKGTTAGDDWNNDENRFDLDQSDYHGFVRFVMPPTLEVGATINEAKLTLGFNNTHAATTITFKAYSQPAAAPTNAAETAAQIASLTTASVAWEAAVSVNATTQITDDISAVIQEVIDHASFQAGDGIVIYMTAATQKRIYTRDLGVSDLRPVLDITWMNPA